MKQNLKKPQVFPQFAKVFLLDTPNYLFLQVLNNQEWSLNCSIHDFFIKDYEVL
jgi:hypothetical protein